MSLLENTWMMHRLDLENESWKLEWIILRWWAPENQTEKTLELLRMGEKNSHNRKQLWEDGIKLEPWILKRMEQDLRETLLRSSQTREWRRETSPWIVETPRNNEEYKGWINNEKILKDLGERHLADDNSFLCQTLKWIYDNSEKEELGKILEKGLWVRAHSKDTPLNNYLKERLHRLK